MPLGSPKTPAGPGKLPPRASNTNPVARICPALHPFGLLLGLAPDLRTEARRPHGTRQTLDVVGPVVAAAVDEEARRAGHPALVGAPHVLADARRVLARAHVVYKALDVEAELLRVVAQVPPRQLVLVREQEVVHRPELPLRGRRLGALRGHL